MYVFEFNDNLRYRSRQALADELRDIADRIESGCSNFPSIMYRAPAGWLHKNFYEGDPSDDDDDDDDEVFRPVFEEEDFEEE